MNQSSKLTWTEEVRKYDEKLNDTSYLSRQTPSSKRHQSRLHESLPGWNEGGMNIHLFDNLTTAAWPFISNHPPFLTYAIPDYAAFVRAKERSHSLADRRDKGGHPVAKEIVFYGQMHISFLTNRFKTNLTLVEKHFGGREMQQNEICAQVWREVCGISLFFTEQYVFIVRLRF